MPTEIFKSANLAEVQVSYQTKVKSSDRVKITSYLECEKILRTIYNAQTIEYREYAFVLFLNRANQVLGYAAVSQGGTAGTVVDPKMIFQTALLCNASKIILSHNHPSGNLTPSREDVKLTQNIKYGATVLEIELLDHVIITADSYFSFADQGIL